MKPDNSLELRIRLRIALLFLIVILYVAGVYFYSNNLKTSIDEQKKEMMEYHNIQSQSEELIFTVQEAQAALNDFLVSPKDSGHLIFDSLLTKVSGQIVVLKQLNPENGTNVFLNDVDSLLSEKKSIILTLNQKLRRRNPIQKISQKIERYDEMVKDSVTITTFKDTTVVIKEIEEKRNIWGRLKNLVKPQPQQDSIIQISEVEQEVVTKSRADTIISADLKSATKEASATYSTQITGIEKQVREIILADQNISLKISTLLSKFHNQTTQITQKGILKSELLIQRIFNFAIFIGALSLIIILIIILFIASDLNKGRRARVDLASEKQLTEKLMESRHKLLLSISHDIKTPLSSIMGYIEMWKQEEPEKNKSHQLKSTYNSAQHILSMLTNLLEFSKLEQNKADLHLSRFSLPDMMQEIIQMFMPITDEKGLEIESVCMIDDSFWIETDYTVLKQILHNVTSNAIKYTSDGKVEIITEYSDELIFTITDSGIGMTEDEIQNIFKPFHRYQNMITTEGSGFGMFVTLGLINSLNGSISILSEKEKGTEVIIKLPIHPIDNNRYADPEKSYKPVYIYDNILIFEDDILLGNMIMEFLNREGLKVDLCSNPNAIKACIGNISGYDIVLTDMEMVHFNGHQILKLIREKDRNIPVWLMTANDDYHPKLAKTDGFEGLIKKPIQLNLLKEILSGNLTDSGEEHKVSNRFSTLTDFFGDDEESIKDVLSTFVTTVHKDTDTLSALIASSGFKEAGQLCHKMHPFIDQTGAESLTEVLRKMDSLREQNESSFPEWKEELQQSITEIRSYADKIKEEYNL